MRDIIEICKELELKNGENLWIDYYTPPSGHYFVINKDNTIQLLSLNNANKKDCEATELYSYIKERMFYEGMIMYDANKTIHSKKKIHSVTSNSLIFKYETLNNIDEFLKPHFEVLINNYLKEKDYLLVLNEFRNYIDLIKTEIPEKIKPTDRIIILKEESLAIYKEEFKIYLKEKIYADNKTEIMVENKSFGVFSIANSLNDKKPLMASNPYSNGNSKAKKSVYRLSFNDCFLLTKAFKLDNTVLIKLIHSENNNIVFEYSATGEITGYNVNYKLFTKNKRTFENISILESNYEHNYNKIIEGDKEKLITLIDYLSDYQLSKLLNIKDGDYKSYIDNAITMKIGTSFVNNKEIFDYYFNRNGEIDIEHLIVKLSEILIENSVLNNETIKFTDGQKKFDLSLTILNYLNKNGGYITMTNNIKEIWFKLIESKNDDNCNEFTIESDKEFFFIAGQILNYLSTQSVSGNKSGLLIQDVFNIKDLKEAKEKITYKYEKYMYLLSIHEKNFVNILFRALIEYKIEENIKINSNEFYKNYYTAGLIGKNIFYTKKEKNKNITENEGEIENEEK